MTKNIKTADVLVVDCQLLQTKAWHRGMGKYSAKLLHAWLTNQKLASHYQTKQLLFNDKLAFSNELEAFAQSLPNTETIMLTLDVPLEGDQHSITIAQETNRKMLDNYLDEKHPGKSVDFLITSLFLDEACPTFPTRSKNAVIYYDLIPLMYYRTYLGLGLSEQYFTRFSVLFDADIIFAISETVANDIVSFLGVSKDKVVNIRGASNTVASDRSTSEPAIPLEKPFILMPTGGDPRKNNLNGVKGFEIFNNTQGGKYSLVITSTFTDAQKTELRELSPDLIFTDNVTDEELWWLYGRAEIVLFPTEYEGLGMPILEAIDADKLVVCSDIAVFREISKDAFFTFSPYDPEDINRAITEALYAEESLVKSKKRHYKDIASQYTWPIAAGIVSSELNAHQTSGIKDKPKIAIVTPHVSQASDDALYFAKQYPMLSEHYDVDYYYDMTDTSLPVRPSYLTFATNIFDILELSKERHAEYDLVLYVIGRGNASVQTLLAALALPGLVVVTTDNLARVYESAADLGYLSRERADNVRSDAFEDIAAVSRGVVSITHTTKLLDQIELQGSRLAYPTMGNRGLENRLFVRYCPGAVDNQWNIDYVADIAQAVDESKVSITLVTPDTATAEVKHLLRFPSVSIYEQVSDHEYLTLLEQADMYVDARPGVFAEKIVPALEAIELGLEVLLNDAVAVAPYIDNERGIHGAVDGAAMRDVTYRWLLIEDIKTEILGPIHRTVSLLEAITNTMGKKDA